ncbi:MAG: hypothetical protein IIA87_04460 [Nanoarchaeota archaeon]|nr:hypothetical protein [Nanoarchaeota archaeon]
MSDDKDIKAELKKIQYLLAGVLLNRNPNVKETAKIIGCSDKVLTKFYPDRSKKKNAKKE